MDTTTCVTLDGCGGGLWVPALLTDIMPLHGYDDKSILVIQCRRKWKNLESSITLCGGRREAAKDAHLIVQRPTCK